MPDGQAIIGDIRAALEGDSRVDHPREIAISSQAGWVQLRGTVGSPRQRGLAIEIAKSVAGVRVCCFAGMAPGEAAVSPAPLDDCRGSPGLRDDRSPGRRRR
jgi:BON domain